MQDPGPGDRGEGFRRLVIRHALEFDRADEVLHQAGGAPAFDQAQQPRRIADDVGEQPVDRADALRLQRKGTFPAPRDARQRSDPGFERRLGERDNGGAELRQRSAVGFARGGLFAKFPGNVK